MKTTVKLSLSEAIVIQPGAHGTVQLDLTVYTVGVVGRPLTQAAALQLAQALQAAAAASEQAHATDRQRGA